MRKPVTEREERGRDRKEGQEGERERRRRRSRRTRRRRRTRARRKRRRGALDKAIAVFWERGSSSDNTGILKILSLEVLG